MAKICTTIEQSKKLIELGIDVNTADMYWSKCTIIDFGDGTLKVSYTAEPCNISQFKNTDEDVPCWSLAALLKLISNWQMQTQDNGIGILYGCKEEIKIIEGETPLDAAFEMVVWLKENGKI